MGRPCVGQPLVRGSAQSMPTSIGSQVPSGLVQCCKVCQIGRCETATSQACPALKSGSLYFSKSLGLWRKVGNPVPNKQTNKTRLVRSFQKGMFLHNATHKHHGPRCSTRSYRRARLRFICCSEQCDRNWVRPYAPFALVNVDLQSSPVSAVPISCVGGSVCVWRICVD
jgi:hypothetical protein